MANDFRHFSIQLDRFAEKVKLSPGLVAKRVAFDLFGRIVRRTPVDTGRARSSWNISVNTVNRAVVAEVRTHVRDQINPRLVQRAKRLAASKFALQPLKNDFVVKTGDTIWISNNLPYIVRLEQGHSRQAPSGMVALSIQEMNVKMSQLIRAGLQDAGL
jgi:hypothetical protein